jgi:hypothetical protein
MDMDVRKPSWTTSSFLIYAGGLTVLGAAFGALGYLASSYGDGTFAGWALLVLGVLYAIAHILKRRDRWLAAGIFAFAAVVAWAFFVGALWVWFGWLSASDGNGFPFHGFSVARLSLELLVLASVFDDLRRFRFPFIAAIGVVVGWLFITDLVSGGGSWSAVVTLAVGLAYLAAGSTTTRPSAFWLHLGAGALIGGSLLYWWHSGDLEWALVAVAALLYVAVAHRSGRSSWAVLGTVGLLLAAGHFAIEWTRLGIPFLIAGANPSNGPRGYVPSLVFAFVGFLLVALGLAVARRRDHLQPE